MSDLIASDEVAFTLPLTASEMKVTHAALKAFHDDFGHDEREVHDVIRRVLAKLPVEGSIRPIELR